MAGLVDAGCAPVQTRSVEDQQCPVCWGVLCEPVSWPGCAHSYCLVCAFRTRLRPKPVCPLCRQPAERARKSTELQVDGARAAQVRRLVGYSKYESQRRELWAEAAALDAHGELGELPLCCMGAWHFPAGSRQQLRLSEPRYREMVRRALAPGGGRRLAVVLEPAELEVGAKGRVCEIVEGSQDMAGDWHVVIEAGAACQVLDMAAEEVQPGEEPLFHGALEEVEEEELTGQADAAPLAAATEMVDILSTLGTHLRAMRQRRRRIAIATASEEDADSVVFGDSASTPAGAAAMQSPSRPSTTSVALPGAGMQQNMPEELVESLADVETQGVGAMLDLLTAYRQIISQMDRLLSEASNTAERLGFVEAAVSRAVTAEPRERERPGVLSVQEVMAGTADTQTNTAPWSPPLSPRERFGQVQQTLRGAGGIGNPSSPVAASEASSSPVGAAVPGGGPSAPRTRGTIGPSPGAARQAPTGPPGSPAAAAVAPGSATPNAGASSTSLRIRSSLRSGGSSGGGARSRLALTASVAAPTVETPGDSGQQQQQQQEQRRAGNISVTTTPCGQAVRRLRSAASSEGGGGGGVQGGSGAGRRGGRRSLSVTVSPSSASGNGGLGFLPLSMLRGGRNVASGSLGGGGSSESRPTSGNGSVSTGANPPSQATSSPIRRVAGRARQAAVFAQAALSTLPGGSRASADERRFA